MQDGSGKLQRDEGSKHIIRLSIEALNWMFIDPAASTEMVKADLAGLLLQIVQDPALELTRPLDAAVMCGLWHLNRQPAGRQQLLQQLTPDSCRVMIDLSLKYLEDPPDHDALACAAGKLPCACFSCSLHRESPKC